MSNNKLKNFIPLELMFKIKYLNQLCRPKDLKDTSKKKIYYLDAPDYSNIGDQAIAYSIRIFAADHFPEYEFIEILQRDVASYLKWLKKHIKKDDMIFLTGGGNMGNYYRIYEATRRIIISSFPNNKIVIFPQSLMYSEDIWGNLSKKKSQRVYNSHSNLIIFAREKDSYEKMKRLYKNVLLCPDIVLSTSGKMPIEFREKEDCIGLCLRNDIEQKLTERDHCIISTISSQNASKVVEISTISDIKEITESNREQIVIGKISEISKCKVLITDRLHAMIFATISHTPCVVFQNSNSKINGTLSWLKKLQHIQMIEQSEDLNKALTKVMSIPCISTDLFDFAIVAKKIRGSLNG